MLIQTNRDSISYRIISHNSRTPIVAQATTSKKNYRVVVSYHTIPELQLLHKLRRLKKITESHLDTSHIPVKSAGALLHAWGKAQTAALAVGSQKKKTFGPSAYAEETTWVEAQRSGPNRTQWRSGVGSGME